MLLFLVASDDDDETSPVGRRNSTGSGSSRKRRQTTDDLFILNSEPDVTSGGAFADTMTRSQAKEKMIAQARAFNEAKTQEKQQQGVTSSSVTSVSPSPAHRKKLDFERKDATSTCTTPAKRMHRHSMSSSKAGDDDVFSESDVEVGTEAEEGMLGTLNTPAKGFVKSVTSRRKNSVSTPSPRRKPSVKRSQSHTGTTPKRRNPKNKTTKEKGEPEREYFTHLEYSCKHQN